jgi:hypothetical protein
MFSSGDFAASLVRLNRRCVWSRLSGNLAERRDVMLRPFAVAR